MKIVTKKLKEPLYFLMCLDEYLFYDTYCKYMLKVGNLWRSGLCRILGYVVRIWGYVVWHNVAFELISFRIV